MTERKPADLAFESWVDRQVREATERGDFDDLPGAGKPLPGLHRAYEEQWWIKDFVQREGLSAEELLPTPLRLRKEIERLPDEIRELPTEQVVREVVNNLNRRIVAWLRAPTEPRVRITPVDADDVVEQWRAQRRRQLAEQRGGSDRSPAPARSAAPARHSAGKWRRFVQLLRGAR